MIAQVWRGVTRAADREACVAQLLAGIHTALADASSCKGAYMLARRTESADVELMVLTLFGDTAASPCGEDEALYRAAVFDRPLACAFDKSVAVYEILTEPRRTLSYANLRRRFPLRLMGPR